MNLDDCLVSASDLAATGSSTPLLLVVLAVALVGVGALLVFAKRSRALMLALALVVGSFAALAVPPTVASADTVCTASLSGQTWLDANGDGIRQDGEEPIANITVTLLNDNGDTLATTTTGDDGQYSFTKLPAGKYRVAFPTGVSGLALTAYRAGDTTRDSDANTDGRTASITLVDGQHVDNIDAGYVTESTPTPTPTQTPTATSASPSPTTSSPTPATGRIGDTVWLDANKDGIQNDSVGLAGVTVNLLDSEGATVATTLTDANGSYVFNNVAAGTYRVQFPTTVNGFIVTQSNQGSNDAVDSDAGEPGTTALFTLAAGETNLTIDAGYVDPESASIGDRLWYDEDWDVEQDPGETGIVGFSVTLYRVTASGNVAVGTQTSGANGAYLFTDLPAGTYRLQFQVDNNTGAEFYRIFINPANVADGSTGWTSEFTLGAAQAKLDMDVAYIEGP